MDKKHFVPGNAHPGQTKKKKLWSELDRVRIAYRLCGMRDQNRWGGVKSEGRCNCCV